jgi:hypothetical protein
MEKDEKKDLTKTLVSVGVGIASLFLVVFIVSKAWKKGQK